MVASLAPKGCKGQNFIPGKRITRGNGKLFLKTMGQRRQASHVIYHYPGKCSARDNPDAELDQIGGHDASEPAGGGIQHRDRDNGTNR
jgi:hypothetical protein